MGARNQQLHPLGLGRNDFDEPQRILAQRPLSYLYRIFRTEGLIEVFAGLRTNRSKYRFRRVVTGHNYDLRTRRKSSGLCKDFQAGDLRHPDVQERQIKVGFSQLFEGFLTVLSL